MAKNGTELAKAYVQIIPSADGIKGKLSGVLDKEVGSAGDEAGKVVGESLVLGIKKAIAAADIGAALQSAIEGMDVQQSLNSIETSFKNSTDKVIETTKNAYKSAELGEVLEKEVENAEKTAEKGIKGKLKNVLKKEADDAGNSAGKIAGNNLASVIKNVIAAAGIGEALRMALTEGANLQQSLGGIETLFKESSDKVIENAKNAYRTDGMSANEYMESVTSFSASLLQGLAGDTNKAADVADMALTDMSDNANKMGTSMELIENAYQGFAKQNYTMLDNLKLGYGGTQTEMQRLLADAQELTGIKYDINNLSDVYTAIHVIQEEMDITGTTAKEAASTFSGSMSMMQSALKNMLGDLTLGEDIRPAMEALISSTGTFLFDNLFPMVGNILTGLVDYIVDTAVNTDWASVITQVLIMVKDALVLGIETYFGSDATLVNDMFGFLIESVPTVIQVIQDGFSLLWEAVNAIWESVGKPIWDAIMTTIQYLADNWGSISSTISVLFQTLWDACSTLWTSIGQPIWDAISYTVTALLELFTEHMQGIAERFQEAVLVIQEIWESVLRPVFEVIGQVLSEYLVPVFEFAFQTIIKPLVDNVFRAIGNMWNNMLKPVFDAICNFLKSVFVRDWDSALTSVLNIVTGIFNGIITAVETPMNTVKDIVNKAIDFIKDKFDFEWSFPSIALPHFSISGSFSLNPPSVPSFGIEWYAKAMNNPMILRKPTIFGYDEVSGQYLGGGEAGAEVIAGASTLMGMIQQAVAGQNAAVVDAVDTGFANLAALLIQYLPQLANMQLVMDSGALVGELAPGMDVALGRLAVRNSRGV